MGAVAIPEFFLAPHVPGECKDTVVNVKGIEIKVHKSVLAFRSPVFRAMFTSGMVEDVENYVKIDDAEPVVFGQVLHYLYLGTCPMFREYASEIFMCAVKYQIDDLIEYCEKLFLDSVDVSSAVDYLILADFTCREDLKTGVMKFISSRLLDVIRTPEWREVDFTLILELIRYLPMYRLALKARYSSTETKYYNEKFKFSSDSSARLEWYVDKFALLSGINASSKCFEVIVGAEVVKFCLMFCRHAHQGEIPNTSEARFYMVVLSDVFKEPLKFEGLFVLHVANPNFDNISSSKLLTWSQDDLQVPWYAVPRRKVVLAVKEADLFPRFREESVIKFSFTLTGQSNRLDHEELPSFDNPYVEMKIQPFLSSDVVRVLADYEVREACWLVSAALNPAFDIMFEAFHKQYEYGTASTSVKNTDAGAVYAPRNCDLKELFTKCEYMLREKLNNANCVMLLIVGHQTKACTLKLAAMHHVVWNIAELLCAPGCLMPLSKLPDLMTELLFNLACLPPLLQDNEVNPPLVL